MDTDDILGIQVLIYAIRDEFEFMNNCNLYGHCSFPLVVCPEIGDLGRYTKYDQN